MNSRIKRGEVYECLFGKYRPALDEQGKAIVSDDGRPAFLRNDFQGPVPYEIQKPRPVVVVGDHKGQYLVVPLSTTLDTHNNPRKTGVAKGFHIRIERSDLSGLARYNAAEVCWAKANMLQAVDRTRLKPLNQHGHPTPKVSGDVLAAIQRAIIKCIGCQDLLETKGAMSETALSSSMSQLEEADLSMCKILINKVNSEVPMVRSLVPAGLRSYSGRVGRKAPAVPNGRKAPRRPANAGLLSSRTGEAAFGSAGRWPATSHNQSTRMCRPTAGTTGMLSPIHFSACR